VYSRPRHHFNILPTIASGFDLIRYVDPVSGSAWLVSLVQSHPTEEVSAIWPNTAHTWGCICRYTYVDMHDKFYG
jgi:hypothetical protein